MTISALLTQGIFLPSDTPLSNKAPAGYGLGTQAKIISKWVVFRPQRMWLEEQADILGIKMQRKTGL